MTSSAPSSDAGLTAAGDAPLGAEVLETRLEELLYAATSHRSAADIAEGLAALPRSSQDLALHWAGVAAQTYTELGCLVAQLAPQALARLDREQVDAWVLGALDCFDRSSGRAALNQLRDIEGFLLRCRRGEAVARFDEVEARLGRFVQGLAGRPLRVAAASDGTAWTDTETIFLPESIADLPGHDANLAQYRLRAALLWGQTRFGTFNADLVGAVAAWPDRDRGLAWLALLEAIRIEARLGRELTGLAAELRGARAPWPSELASAATALGTGDAAIGDSLRVLETLRRAGASDRAPAACPQAGRLDPEAARRVRDERVERDLAVLRLAVRLARPAVAGAREREATGERPASVTVDAGASIALRIDREAIALLPDARAAIQSLLQDLGEIPPDALVAAGPAPWVPVDPDARRDAGPGAAAPTGTQSADYVYDEWDCRRQAFRVGWCHVYEHLVGEGEPAYVPAVRLRHAPLIRQLRRRFEVLRGEDRLRRRQPDGEEVDLDALVAARADRLAGAQVSPNLFARRLRHERSLAVLFMVDMSGSTQGWINDAEREALVMLGEAVETLGDAWAIYGFSGWTRTRCDLYRVKSFDEPYDATIQRRIAAIEPKDYTRMGVAIRHLSRLLAAQPAKHRLLVTLSDGKPDDFADDYRSRYGIEDTRHALLEARSRGVRSYCVTIDRDGADYLRHMYGPARYTVLDDVRKLPLRIADIYRRLAT